MHVQESRNETANKDSPAGLKRHVGAGLLMVNDCGMVHQNRESRQTVRKKWQ